METSLDPRQARRLLDEIASLAEHASLTGSLTGGAEAAVRRYNLVLSGLESAGSIPKGFFEALPADVGYDRLGVEARLLRGVLDGDRHEAGHRHRCGEASLLVRLAPFLDQEDLRALLKTQLESGAEVDEHLITALAPFLEGRSLHDLVARFLERPGHPEHPRHPELPTAPGAPTPPEEPRAPEHRPVPVTDDLDLIEDLNVRMRELTLEMSRSDLSEQERSALAAELVRVGFQHGQASSQSR